MDRKRLSFLFHHYLNNTCTDQERRELFQLIDSAEHDAHLKELIDQAWEESSATSHAPLAKNLADQILVQSRGPVEGRKNLFPKLLIASAVTLSLAVGWWLSDGVIRAHPEPLAASRAAKPVAPKFLQLPDGSTAILKEGSVLDYPASFDRNTREVSLIGEAYFDIKHDPSKPFVVRTGMLTTKVLGTAFNVKALPGEEEIVVTVTRGKVEVRDEENVLGVIHPDEQITFHKSSSIAMQSAVEAKAVSNWIQNDIFFEDVTMEQAVEELEKRFDITIELTNEDVKKCRFTATFIQGEEIDQILQVICEFNGAAYEYREEKIVAITGAGCH